MLWILSTKFHTCLCICSCLEYLHIHNHSCSHLAISVLDYISYPCTHRSPLQINNTFKVLKVISKFVSIVNLKLPMNTYCLQRLYMVHLHGTYTLYTAVGPTFSGERVQNFSMRELANCSDQIKNTTCQLWRNINKCLVSGERLYQVLLIKFITCHYSNINFYDYVHHLPLFLATIKTTALSNRSTTILPTSTWFII